MKKILLTATICLLSTAAWSQQRITDRYGRLIDPPVFSEEGNDLMIARKEPSSFSATGRRNDLSKGSSDHPYVQHNSSPRVLTILVNFSDSAITVNQPKTAFSQLFNHQGDLDDLGNGNTRNYSSVRQYFSDMSKGTFTPQFDVYGPVTVPDTMGYYGGNNANNSSGERHQQLVSDALSLLTDSIADASIYDNDGDGKIDCVYIIYAGFGQNNGGGGNTVWANTGQASGSFKGLSLNWYSMAGELAPYLVSQANHNWMITGLGVVCHEFSHALGLPDIYPTNSRAYLDNQEMEYWDLMDGGEYVYNGFRPTAYTAWEKELMGWPVDIQTLSATTDAVTMSTTTEAGGTVYKIVNDDEPQEYFLLENIQRQGWNRYLPGHGLLVYHVNQAGNETIYMGTRLNNTANQPGMAVVPADSVCLSSYLSDAQHTSTLYRNSHRGDPFPGTSQVTRLDDNMGLPNFYWYKSNNEAAATNPKFHKVNKALKNIAEQDGIITFDFIGNYATGITDVKRANTASEPIYTIDGRRVNTDIHQLPQGIYLRGGHKFIVK